VIIVDGHEKKTKARVTWDGKKVECDNEKFFAYLKKECGSTKDGEEFLEEVMLRFKSGYLHAYQIG
jgi:hypothetical protein